MCWAPIRGWDSGRGAAVSASKELGLMGRAGRAHTTRFQVIVGGCAGSRAGAQGVGTGGLASPWQLVASLKRQVEQRVAWNEGLLPRSGVSRAEQSHQREPGSRGAGMGMCASRVWCAWGRGRLQSRLESTPARPPSAMCYQVPPPPQPCLPGGQSQPTQSPICL